MENHERLGVCGIRRYLQKTGRRFRQTLLRIEHLFIWKEIIEEGLKKDSTSYVNKLNELTASNAQSLETYFNNGFKIESPEQFTKEFGGFE